VVYSVFQEKPQSEQLEEYHKKHILKYGLSQCLGLESEAYGIGL